MMMRPAFQAILAVILPAMICGACTSAGHLSQETVRSLAEEAGVKSVWYTDQLAYEDDGEPGGFVDVLENPRQFARNLCLSDHTRITFRRTAGGPAILQKQTSVQLALRSCEGVKGGDFRRMEGSIAPEKLAELFVVVFLVAADGANGYPKLSVSYESEEVQRLSRMVTRSMFWSVNVDRNGRARVNFLDRRFGLSFLCFVVSFEPNGFRHVYVEQEFSIDIAPR